MEFMNMPIYLYATAYQPPNGHARSLPREEMQRC